MVTVATNRGEWQGNGNSTHHLDDFEVDDLPDSALSWP